MAAALATEQILRRRQASAWVQLLLALLAACRRSPPPPPYAGSLVEITARALPGGVARVVASAEEGTSAELRPGGSPAELAGALALPPGPHIVKLEAFGAGGAKVAALSLPLATARGSPALLDATPGAAGGALIESIVAPRSTVVAGERMALQARVAARAGLRVAWTASPRGCATFASESAPATELIAAAPGTCQIKLTAATADGADSRTIAVVVRSSGRSFELPLQVAPGGRHLVDQRGAPVLIKGEAAWLLLVNLTESEQELYLADRAAKGFNLVEVMLTNHNYTQSPNPSPPANRTGEQPFLEPGHFATPNDAYFARAAAFVDRAAAHGLAVLIAPNFLGFDGAHEGWWQELTSPANTRAVCAAFGRYLGARFKDKKNVLWLAGGDFAPPTGSEGEARHWEIVSGIRAAGAAQLWTGHWNFGHQGGISTDEERFRDAMALNGVYQYANTYKYASRAYDVKPPRPMYLLESTYEHEHPTNNTQPFRKAWWWTMLSGGAGVLWGNTFLWMAESARGRYRVEYGDVDRAVSSFAAELSSQGTEEALHLHALFEALPWQRLLPAGPASGSHELVTSGQRWGQRHIAAAATPEGDLLVAYLPPAGTGSRELALDLSRMRGPGRARWYDPTAGAWVRLGKRLRNERGVELETPGANRSGANDWVLVVDVPEQP